MNAITPIRHPSAAGSLPTSVDGGDNFQALPKVIQKGIAKLLVAFPAGTQALGEGDGRLRMDIFAEAVDAMPVVIAVTALKYMLFNNPQNPFSPTPQDIREVCEHDYDAWACAAVGYTVGGEWRVPVITEKVTIKLRSGVNHTVGKRTVRQYPICPPPWTDGCHLSPVTVREMLRSDGARWSLVSDKLAPGRFSGNAPAPDEIFNRIPRDVFEPGEREEMQKRRADWYANEQERKRLF